MTLKESPSQTAGPYVHIGCVPTRAGLDGPDPGAVMVTGDAAGRPIALTVALFDGEGARIEDAVVEIWQADGAGRHRAPGFAGWGRAACVDGLHRFRTVKPGIVPETRPQAPHVLVWIVARGINLALTTRLYFPDEDNAADPVLRAAGGRADTMVARATEDGYHLDIRLQGEGETVFLDV